MGSIQQLSAFHRMAMNVHVCFCSPAAVGEKRWSHYIGVTWDTDSNHWRARFVPEKGPVEELGLFGSQQEAGEAYDRHALQALGPKGVRNHPPSYYTGEP